MDSDCTEDYTDGIRRVSATTTDDSADYEMEKLEPKNTFTYRPMTNSMQRGKKRSSRSNVLLMSLLVLVAVVIVLQIGTIVFFALQGCPSVAPVDTTSSQLTVQQNFKMLTESFQMLNRLLNITANSTEELQLLFQSLSNFEGSFTFTRSVIDDILLIVEELLNIRNSSSITSKLPFSCKDILLSDPGALSGYYYINNRQIYCEMNELCGSSRGWTRIGYLDMIKLQDNCPPEFTLTENGEIRGCGRSETSPGCASVKFSSLGIHYSEVCGRVVGYQKGNPDAVDTRQSARTDINSYYVDGVSITCGYPRQHVWTLMAGVHESNYDDGNCPCNSPPGSTQKVQPFIGNDYFCESGNPTSTHDDFYGADPLWDGKGCGSQELKCCSSPGLPWFHKTLNSTTSDYIELRECGDESKDTEDVIVTYYEIYIR